MHLMFNCFQMASSKYMKYMEPFDESDISFSVEGKPIYAVKSIMTMWSPVFKVMFSSAEVVQVPDKSFEDFMELVCALHPPYKPIDGKPYNISHNHNCQSSKHQKILTVDSCVICYAFSFGIAYHPNGRERYVSTDGHFYCATLC